MLLKVSDGVGGWILFDKVEQAYLIAKSHTVNSPHELSSLGDDQTLNLVSKECFQRMTEVRVGIIEFVTNGNTRKALFTNTVYICDDAGDTLDRLTVRSPKEVSRK